MAFFKDGLFFDYSNGEGEKEDKKKKKGREKRQEEGKLNESRARWLAGAKRKGLAEWIEGERAYLQAGIHIYASFFSPCSYYHHHHLGSRHRHKLFPLHHLVTVSALSCADYTLTQGERHFSTPPGFTLNPPCFRLEAPCALALP